MPLWYVREAEHVEGIARRFGVDAEALWDDARNAALRRLRGDGHQLLLGDIVFVPERTRAPAMRIAPGDRKLYVGPLLMVRVDVSLHDNRGPIANEPFELEAEGHRARGVSGARGELSLRVPAHAQRARVLFARSGRVFNLVVGGMNPASDASGVQMRLRQLGFLHAEPSAHLDDAATEDALRRFQRSEGFEPTGRIDAPTRDALVARYGC